MTTEEVYTMYCVKCRKKQECIISEKLVRMFKGNCKVCQCKTNIFIKPQNIEEPKAPKKVPESKEEKKGSKIKEKTKKSTT